MVASLGVALRKEITIVASNRSHLLSMTQAELSKTEPELLIEGLGVACRSLLEAVKGHRPSYERLLKVAAERDVNWKQLSECQTRLDRENQNHEGRCRLLEAKLDQAIQGLKEKDQKIRSLEQETEVLRIKIIKLEREVDVSHMSKGENTHKSLSAFDRVVDIRELYELKKIINEEKNDMNVVAAKNKQISSLKMLNKKKDQALVKGSQS